MEYQEALTRWARKLADRDPRMADERFIRWDDDRPVTLEVNYEPGGGCSYGTCDYDAYTTITLTVPFIRQRRGLAGTGDLVALIDGKVVYRNETDEVPWAWTKEWNPAYDTFSFSDVLAGILEEANGTGS